MLPGEPREIVGVLPRKQEVTGNHRIEGDALELHPVFLQDDQVAFKIMADLADFRAAKERPHGIQNILIGKPGLTALIGLREGDIIGSVVLKTDGNAAYPCAHGV